MTDLILIRRSDDGRATLGDLHIHPAPLFLCHTLENTWRNNQRSISCIPPGRYPLQLRNEGGWDRRYRNKHSWHEGMIEVVVPGRDFILFHAGNTHEDTKGCILPGKTHGPDGNGNHAVWSSGDAYAEIYPVLLQAAKNGGHLHIIPAPEAVRDAFDSS